ncbi:hypothetical protein Pcinc_022619 [Petrolisthes cinctipes]|uniref:Uncharacterized protein n=1 Tax=Petrolisthes cinctipes TaxID=88211 RepID=A0AAE1KDG5_PETCI|nr:hypothetical protein Pcinc_022619 [Petrolisthes cinctipes]
MSPINVTHACQALNTLKFNLGSGMLLTPKARGLVKHTRCCYMRGHHGANWPTSRGTTPPSQATRMREPPPSSPLPNPSLYLPELLHFPPSSESRTSKLVNLGVISRQKQSPRIGPIRPGEHHTQPPP